jgi:hypothetical protein
MDEHIGLSIVHGMGEQKRFETARQVAPSILGVFRACDRDTRFYCPPWGLR